MAKIVADLKLLDELAPMMLPEDPNVQDELQIPSEQRENMDTLLRQVWQEEGNMRHANSASQQPSVTEDLRRITAISFQSC